MVNVNSSWWTLQCILSTHFRLEVLGFCFRLNLIVVRLANGLPWAGIRSSPFPFFSNLGCFAGIRSTIGFGFSNEISASIRWLVVFSSDVFAVTSSLSSPFSLFATVSCLASCANLDWSTTLHLTANTLNKWSFYPQGLTRPLML